MATIEEIKARYKSYKFGMYHPIQYPEAPDDCGDLIRMVEQLQAQLERILDAEIPWEYGMMKLRHTAVVKAATKGEK